jgi:hypothetical protein
MAITAICSPKPALAGLDTELTMRSTSFTVIENAFMAMEVRESVIFIMKERVPVFDGVPEILPVELFKLKPSGRVPE